MSSAQTGTKTVREINKNFKYYKWSNNEKQQGGKKQSQTQTLITPAPAPAIVTDAVTGISGITNSNANQLSLGKTYKYNLNMSFIKLYYNNERVVFQTPMLFVPYAPRKGEFGSGQSGSGEPVSGSGAGFKESYYLTASLFNDEYDNDIGEFESWINDLEVQTLKLLRKRPYLNAAATGKTPLLKFDDYRGCQKLNLKFERGNAKFYVIEGKSRLSKAVPFQEIATPCYAVFIIELGGVWIRKHAVNDADAETEWGINFILHGAQCTPSHTEPSPLGIQPTDFIYNQGMHNVSSQILAPPPPPPPPQINPLLVPYLKMLKLGIPRDAVRQKMMLAGDDPSLLDNPIPPTPFLGGIPPPPFLGGIPPTPFLGGIPPPPFLGGIPPPPFLGGIPPPPPPFQLLGSGRNQLTQCEPPKITNDMLATIRLKKAVADNDPRHTQNHHKTPLKTQQEGFKVDLSDILSIKSMLKSRTATEQDKAVADNDPSYTHHKTPLKTQQQGFKINLSDILSIKSRLKSRTATEQDKDSYSKIFKKD